MSDDPHHRKPGAHIATGFHRDFTYRPEQTKRQMQDILADAARNTAAIKPPKETDRADRK